MFRCGVFLGPAIEPVALALKHPPVGHQNTDPCFHPVSGHAFYAEVERGLDQVAPGPGGFAFADDPDRRSGCHLSAQLRGRQGDPLQAIGCQCVRWPSVELHAVAERAQNLLHPLRRSQRALAPLRAAFARLFDQRLGIEPQPGSALGPFLPERQLAVRIELGIAGALGDFTQGFCVVCALPEFLGRRQNGQATLAEGFDHIARHALDLELPVLARDLGFVAKLLEVRPQRGVVDGAKDCVVLPDLSVPQRLPVASLVLRHRSNDSMGMVLRVHLDHLDAHLDEQGARRFLPKVIFRAVTARNQRRRSAHEFGVVVAVVEDRPWHAAPVHRIEDDVRFGIIEALDEGAGQIENDAAMPALARLRDDLLQLGCLASASRPDEHRMALLKSPGNRHTCQTVRRMQTGPDTVLQWLFEDLVGVHCRRALAALADMRFPVMAGDGLSQLAVCHKHSTALMALGQNVGAAPFRKVDEPDGQRHTDKPGRYCCHAFPA